MHPVALAEMVDRVFDDRYRVEELIGSGMISAVYVAHDTVEDRLVAIKVFAAEIAADEPYVKRLFEAVEQAALLNHPNVVDIYDWGNDGGPYLVSELCEGGSLAALLASGHRLAPSQALVMTLECARALNYGHEQGAVHGYLSPSAVLFTDDQRVRIADYGLTEVLADAPVAQADRALDNVRYSSPEQARGRHVGESTDLYSLALLVNEAVSGQPPVVSDTVVGTLMARAESAADPHGSLEGLAQPIERCGRVDPAERPEAEELAIALLAAAETMARPNAFPLVGIEALPSARQSGLLVAGGVEGAARSTSPDHDARGDDDFDDAVLGRLDDSDTLADDTDAGSDQRAPELALVAEAASIGGLENLEQAEPVFAAVPGSQVTSEELDIPASAPSKRAAAPAYEEARDDADDRLPWWPLFLLGTLLAAAVAGALYVFALSSPDASTQVPDLVGVAGDEIEARLSELEWDVERLETRIDGTTAGSIVAQSPPAGTELDESERVTITVSLGNEMVEIPGDIVGYTVEQAAARLAEVGLSVGQLAEENSELLGAGLVIGLDEPTTQKPMGEPVALRVSLGAEDRIVPESVIGLAIGDATTLLVGLRLQAVEEPAYSPDAEVGTVLAAIPPPNSLVAADSAVRLVVSAGPEPVEIPDIVGLPLDEAVDAIEAIGLIFIDTVGTPGEDVIGSLPQPGEIVDVGTEIVIVLDDPPEDE